MKLACVVVVALGCGSSSLEPGKLHGGIEDSDKHWRARYKGTGVDIAQIPQVANAVGLPVGGSVDVDIDVTVPKQNGQLDYSLARGIIDVECTADCSVGGDGAVLKPRLNNARAAAFAGDGIQFGKLALGKLSARIEIGDGTARITRWQLSSPDIEIALAFEAQLAKELGHISADGCLRYKTTPTLRERDPKLDAVFAATGAVRGDDGFYAIKLTRPSGRTRILAQPCTI